MTSRTFTLPGVLTVGQEPRSGPGLWVSRMRWGLDGCLESRPVLEEVRVASLGWEPF